eukprot:4993363-Prymnesium_polylepis.1
MSAAVDTPAVKGGSETDITSLKNRPKKTPRKRENVIQPRCSAPKKPAHSLETEVDGVPTHRFVYRPLSRQTRTEA